MRLPWYRTGYLAKWCTAAIEFMRSVTPVESADIIPTRTQDGTFYRLRNPDPKSIGVVEWSDKVEGSLYTVYSAPILWGSFRIYPDFLNYVSFPAEMYLDVAAVTEAGRWVFLEIRTAEIEWGLPDSDSGALPEENNLKLSDDDKKPVHNLDQGIMRFPLSMWKRVDGYILRASTCQVGGINIPAVFAPPVSQ